MGLFHTGRRRQYVVDKKFQLRATLVGVVYIVAVTASLGLLVGYLTRSMGLLLEAHSEELTTLYYAQQRDMMVTTTLFLVSISAAWIFFTIWRTHKIAGPMYKIKKLMSEVDGDSLHIAGALRKGDEMWELFEAFNSMIEKLRKHQSDEAKRVAKLLDKLDKAEDDEERKEIAKELRTFKDQMEAALE